MSKLLDQTEAIAGVGQVKWSNDWFHKEHGDYFKRILQNLLGVRRDYLDPLKIEAYNLFFMRELPENGGGIQIRAKLQQANSAPLCTVYSDRLDDTHINKLFDYFLKVEKPKVRKKLPLEPNKRR